MDGLLMPGNGWGIKEGQFRKQSAVFAAVKPVTAAMCQLQLFFSRISRDDRRDVLGRIRPVGQWPMAGHGDRYGHGGRRHPGLSDPPE